jgi:soluble lytic murein transglycosylase
VLDVPLTEARERVEGGDIRFILEAEPSRLAELSNIDSALPFYTALLIEKEDGSKEKTLMLLREALKSPLARDAALKKIAAIEGRGAEANGDGGAIDAARAALVRRDYNTALRKFRAALADDRDAFLQDTALLGDLGRAFQYAFIAGEGSAAKAGAELFLLWEAELTEPTAPPELTESTGPTELTAPTEGRFRTLTADERRERRYLLLYYAARMKRQLGLSEAAAALFERALPLAPTGEQRDACIWYLLDMSFGKTATDTKSIPKTIGLIEKYAKVWHDPAYFADIFDKLAHRLCLNGLWDEAAALFPCVRKYGSAETIAKYAFILGNAVEINLLPPEKAAVALGRNTRRYGGASAPRPADFYRIAADSRIVAGRDTSAFYYNDAAARKLGFEPRLNIPETDGTEAAKSAAKRESAKRTEARPLKSFLDGFFIFGAAQFAYPYIIENADALSTQELRSLAKSLAEAERWAESVRVARTYMARPDYEAAIEDVRICYPFAFADVVGKTARETGVDEALLYGLIRTESLFVPNAVSRAGAQGLTQLMPATARETALRLSRYGPDYFDGERLDLADPSVNIHLGAFYYSSLKERMGELLALLSYNGGMTRVRRWRAARPALNDALFLETVEYAETREYGRQVLAATAIYRLLAAKSSS